jgi:hypothetical protein
VEESHICGNYFRSSLNFQQANATKSVFVAVAHFLVWRRQHISQIFFSMASSSFCIIFAALLKRRVQLILNAPRAGLLAQTLTIVLTGS